MTKNQQLLLEVLQDYGLKEVPGAMSNQEILDMIRQFIPNAGDDSKYGWCGIYLATKMKKLGFTPPQTPQLARNYMNIPGTVEVSLEDAKPGDFVVFWRESIDSWKGHIALFINERGKYVNVVGGNQTNEMNIRPYASSRILGIFRYESN